MSLLIPASWRDVVVGYNGATVYLKDVAKVVDTVKERAQETYNNGTAKVPL